MRMKKITVSALVFALSLVCLVSGAFAADVVVRGSDVSYQFAQNAAKVFNQATGLDVSVTSQKKNDAIKALAAGEVDIATSTWSLAELDDQEVLDALAEARAKGYTFSEIPFVIDATQALVNPANGVRNITLGQLHQIYTGQITNWSALGGADRPIRVYTTDSSDGKYIMWKKWVLQGGQDTGTVVSKSDMAPLVASEDNAIGFDATSYVVASRDSGDLAFLNVASQAVNGKYAPSRKYPVSRYLYLITRNDIKANADAFLDYMVTFDAQKLAPSVHQIPLLPEVGLVGFELVDRLGEERGVLFDPSKNTTMRFDFTGIASPVKLYVGNNSALDAKEIVIVRAGTRTSAQFVSHFVATSNLSKFAIADDVTEYTIADLAEGDSIEFVYDGLTKTIYVTSGGSDGGSSGGCNAGTVAPALIFAASLWVLGVKRKK